jgi:hypothetical protein
MVVNIMTYKWCGLSDRKVDIETDNITHISNRQDGMFIVRLKNGDGVRVKDISLLKKAGSK